ncbi:60S ribosomal protein L14-1-like [Pyrus ussuriensis x Pyrus communis]|uniref:60S ribosomal protein L14-1-like n=1 Tax=Pyrus ussuriensis x Pyrus communis TaxID=2448454 RepID=A0A5N5F8W5_9ROSA|nr:60S ribosomal protein L14-1-like [Pyrus ussuriensis x Pyrus communis]
MAQADEDEIKPPPGRPAEDLKTPEMPDRSLGPVGMVAGRRSVEVVDDDDEELPVALSVVDESHLSDLDLPLERPLGVVGGRQSVEVAEGLRMGERGRKTREREREWKTREAENDGE